MNPLLSMLNSQKKVNYTPTGNMLSDFAAFKQSMQGKDLEAIVNDLRASGRMSEQQYQSLLQSAKSLMNVLK